VWNIQRAQLFVSGQTKPKTKFEQLQLSQLTIFLLKLWTTELPANALIGWFPK